MILQPDVGPIRAQHHLPARPDTVLWGRLPCATDAPVLSLSKTVEASVLPLALLLRGVPLGAISPVIILHRTRTTVLTTASPRR